MICRQTIDTPLFEPMLTLSTDECLRHFGLNMLRKTNQWRIAVTKAMSPLSDTLISVLSDAYCTYSKVIAIQSK